MKKLNLGNGYSIRYQSQELPNGAEDAIWAIEKEGQLVDEKTANRIWMLFYDEINEFIEASNTKRIDAPDDPF